MDKFLRIKQEFLNATTKEIASEKLTLLKQMLNENPEKYAKEYLALNNQKLNDLKELNVKLALQEISEFISFSAIAKKYFGKSKEWFYQRLNENIVNGKPAKFTPEEINTLNLALQDISKKIGSLRVA